MTKTPEEMAEEYRKVWGDEQLYKIRHEHKRFDWDDALIDGFLAGYQAAQQWISVKERLPESWVHVLIYQFPTTWVSGYCHERKRWGYYESGEPCHPTHWMPLPKPPED